MLQDMVVDGTPCRPGRRDMCISGRCRVRRHTERIRSIFCIKTTNTQKSKMWHRKTQEVKDMASAETAKPTTKGQPKEEKRHI